MDMKYADITPLKEVLSSLDKVEKGIRQKNA
jgi:hypothetical protein